MDRSRKSAEYKRHQLQACILHIDKPVTRHIELDASPLNRPTAGSPLDSTPLAGDVGVRAIIGEMASLAALRDGTGTGSALSSSKVEHAGVP